MTTVVPWSTLATAALVGMAVTGALTPLWAAAAARLGLVDRPNARSLHTRATPRGGGVALLAGAAAGLAVTDPLASGADPVARALALGALLVSAAGLWDDRFGLVPSVRLVLQAAAAALVVAAGGLLERLPLPSPFDFPLGAAGAPLTVLWIVAVVNFFNFLDGADGLAGAQGLVTATAVALAGWSAAGTLLGAALAGACAGFLAFNWAPARVFMGDAGSALLGFCFATAPLLASPERRAPAVLLVGTSLFLCLADATWTLLRRARRGDRWYEAHREHVYQRLILGGWTHAQMATRLAAAAAAVTLVAVLAWTTRSGALSWAALGLGAASFSAEARLASSGRRAARPSSRDAA